MSLLANSNAIESGGYPIQRSLRFRSSASAYLSRTPASAGNRKTWTWSAWVKRGALGGTQVLWEATDSAGSTVRATNRFASDTLSGSDSSTGLSYTTTQVFRDASAWYHIVLSMDTTQATSTNRFKLYVNGVQVTAFSSITYPTLNTDTLFNSNLYFNYIGGTTPAFVQFLDGYLAEVNFIDGQALTPSSFGYTEPLTGVWQPLKYMGTYGTNGFYLPFTDNTSATTLAYDKSGNGNNWTPNNISTTAGATYDSMTDVPTLTSATAANYCVLNPLDSALTLINANLSWSAPSNTEKGARGTIGVSSGKWYYEYQLTSATATPFSLIGWASQTQSNTSVMPTGVGATAWAYYANDLKTYNNGTASAVYGTSGSASDIIMVALDLDNSKIYWGRNGTWFNSGNPATSTNPAYTNVSGTLFPWIQEYNQSTSANFGQRPFSYTPPTGFKALNTFNLPDPTIKKPNQYMDATTYTGTGVSNAVVNAAGFQPDLVWLKNRNYAPGTNHVLIDSVRGTSVGLASNLTNADFSVTANFSGINSNGFTVTGTTHDYNFSTDTFVGWQWKESATAGFDIVTYTGTGSAQNINHSLGVAPKMIITKSRNNATGWAVYHASFGNTGAGFLNGTGAWDSPTAAYWNNTSPTSSVFTVGTANLTNFSSYTYVAYLFAEIAGFSKFGSYTGNGSANGPFVYCGFRPKYVMVKRTDTAGNSWDIFDAARNTYNLTDLNLYANLSDAEGASTSHCVDLVSNGFKIRGTGTNINASGGTYIFAAFAENPLKFANAR